MELSRNRYRGSLAMLLAVALAVRAAAAFWWQTRLGDHPFAFGDSESYWLMTRNWVIDGAFQYGSSESRMFRVPGYPMLLAPLFWLGGEHPPVMAARLLGAVLGTASVAGVAAIGRRLFGDLAALVAAAWAAVYPGAIGMSVFVLSEALFCPLMVASLWLWIVAWQRPRIAVEPKAQDGVPSIRHRAFVDAGSSRAVASGFLAGLATLTRPSWLLFIPFSLLLVFLLSGERRRHAVLGMAIVLGFVVAMTPWWIRNWRITNRFVPTTLQVGATLYDSFHDGGTGGSDTDMQFVPRFLQQQRAEDQAAMERGEKPTSTFEYRVDRRMQEAAVEWAVTHPGEAVRLALAKAWRTWSPWPHAEELQSNTMRLAVAAGYLPIIGFGMVGFGRYARRGWPYVLCAMPTCYTACLHTVFVGSIRYRQPAMLMLIVLAAPVVVSLVAQCCAARRKEPPCAV